MHETAAAKTDRFAFHVKRAEQLPLSLRRFYEAQAHAGSCNIFAPPLTGLSLSHRQPSAGYLIMLFAHRLLIVIDRSNYLVQTMDIPFDDVICVEMGQVLLLSWMKIVFGRHTCEEIKIPFNTVGFDLFRQVLNTIRYRLDASGGLGTSIQSTAELPLKFGNELRDWLFADEKVISYAFQPELRRRRLLLLSKQVAAPLLVALTDRQLLWLTEEPAVAFERLGEYSEIYTYSPLSRLRSIAVERRGEAQIVALRLSLTNESASFSREALISLDMASEFESFCRTAEFEVRLAEPSASVH
jgi:hypothetical protein